MAPASTATSGDSGVILSPDTSSTSRIHDATGDASRSRPIVCGAVRSKMEIGETRTVPRRSSRVISPRVRRPAARVW